jgi:tRNA dimethylallyltransferase
LAERFGGEIVSADSRQVYRELNLGAGKDYADYLTVSGARIPAHVLDITDLSREYSVFDFQRDALQSLRGIWGRGMLPILTGGTGLYLESVLLRYDLSAAPPDPARQRALDSLSDEALLDRLATLDKIPHNTTDVSDRKRLIRAVEIAQSQAEQGSRLLWPEFSSLVLGVQWERATLRQRIQNRLHQRLEAGMVDEVKALLGQGVSLARLKSLGLEYRSLVEHLEGGLSLHAMEEKLFLKICDFAKRQMTWFRRMERRGVGIHWLDGDAFEQAVSEVAHWLAQ